MGKKLTIGVMIGNSYSMHSRKLMQGIRDASKELDVNIVFFMGMHMSDYYYDYFEKKMDNRQDYQHNVVYDYANLVDVDGLIIIYGSFESFLEDKDKNHFLERFKGIPYLVATDHDDSHMGGSVISDNYQGMFRVVEHLITEHECRKFLYVSGPKDNTDSMERELAFRSALAKYQIPFDEECYTEGNFSTCCDEKIGELLDKHPHADAIVCANDAMASVAYDECIKRNIEVGKDIAVTGYDDWGMAESMTPPLTTVFQNEYGMGYICLTNILQQCKGEPPVDATMPAKLVVRSSCGCKSKCEDTCPTQVDVVDERDSYNINSERDIMFIPLVSSDMQSNMYDEATFYKCPMKMLKLLRAKSAYLYVFDRPQRHLYAEKWEHPSHMYLASCYENGEIISYAPDKRPVFDTGKEKIFAIQDGKQRVFTAFNLLHGMHQYGLLMLEIDAEDMLLMHLVSMQISNSLNFFDMYKRQMDMQGQLGYLVEAVDAKNKILGFISEYDELTGLLNRRGFMEKAMEFIRNKNNEKGILLIADLDHLKEINDCFGHVAGDFAIQSAARLLMKAMGEETLIARIGGDEFVVLVPCESEATGDNLILHLRKTCAEFNQNTRKEFYVELSAGYAVFVCGVDVDFNSILASSDEMLYEAKKTRRTSIKKNQ